MIPSSGNSPYSGYNAYQDQDHDSAMQSEKDRAKMDQLIAAKDMNDAKKDSYDKATIQARN